MIRNNLFVLDTNLLISALLFSQSKSRFAFETAVNTGVLIASNDTFAEFREVLGRNKLNKYNSLRERIQFANDLNKLIVFFEPETKISDCRDPKDNKFLELAVAAKASCIITGDDDLLVLHPLSAGQAGFRGIPILNANDFLNMTF